MRPFALLSGAPRYIVGALMIAVTLLVNVEVGFRFALDLPLDAISELVLLLFPWLTLLGAAVALNTAGANVALHLLSGRVGDRALTRIHGIVALATLGFGLFMILQGTRYALMTRNELSNVLEISRSWEVLAFPVAGALFVLFSLRPVLRLFRPRRPVAAPAVSQGKA